MQKYFDIIQRILVSGASITVVAVAMNHSTSTRPQGKENLPDPITATEQDEQKPN